MRKRKRRMYPFWKFWFKRPWVNLRWKIKNFWDKFLFKFFGFWYCDCCDKRFSPRVIKYVDGDCWLCSFCWDENTKLMQQGRSNG